MNINNVVLAGRLTKDPELRYTPNGVPVATFTIAVNRPFKNAQEQTEADFPNIVVWRKPAENVANYLKKGDECGIVGRLQTRSYDGTDGKRVYITEIVAETVQFGAKKNSGNNQSGNQQNSNREQRNNNFTRVDDDPFANNGNTIDISDDDLPF